MKNVLTQVQIHWYSPFYVTNMISQASALLWVEICIRLNMIIINISFFSQSGWTISIPINTLFNNENNCLNRNMTLGLDREITNVLFLLCDVNVWQSNSLLGKWGLLRLIKFLTIVYTWVVSFIFCYCLLDLQAHC